MDLKKLEIAIDRIRSSSTQAKEKPPPGLNEIIASIKKVFQDYWRDEHLPLAINIAKTIGEGIPTPVLSVCGKGTREIRFTKYLAYFMDSKKDHGLGSLLLSTAFDEIARDFKLAEDWADDCTVIPEYWLGRLANKKSGKKRDCICDIGIVGSDFLFAIEHKILSGEGPAGETGLTQLQRYSRAIDKNPEFKDKIIIKIYLTPTGKENKGVMDWLPMSHLHIIKQAQQCLAGTNISETARENLRRLLIDLFLGPYEETEELILEMKDAALSLTVDPVSLHEVVKFRRLVENNRLLINMLLGGSR